MISLPQIPDELVACCPFFFLFFLLTALTNESDKRQFANENKGMVAFNKGTLPTKLTFQPFLSLFRAITCKDMSTDCVASMPTQFNNSQRLSQ
jgi:hypothetical protein